MLKLDHLTVIAPTLSEGVAHVRDCLGLEVPFGAHHDYMGTHNHRLRLGDDVYLEIVALDPAGRAPGRARWFGLDDQAQVRADWNEGRRLRGWVAGTTAIASLVAALGALFGEQVSLPGDNPSFDFAIPADGALPLDGAAPSIIDRRGVPPSAEVIPDLGARLRGFTLEHPEPVAIEALYRDLDIDRPPAVRQGLRLRYRAEIETAAGMKILT